MRVNEIFYSLQGEGRHTGRPAVFVRFSGCNLKCPFCDTDFKDYKDMGVAEIVDKVREYRPCPFVVLTGGEPTMQSHLEELIDALHKENIYVAIETNGTRPYPHNADWVTVSPKTPFTDHARLCRDNKPADEVKVIFDGEHDISEYAIYGREKYVQPCDTGDTDMNGAILRQAISFIKENPKWKLSLQTQKILKVR